MRRQPTSRNTYFNSRLHIGADNSCRQLWARVFHFNSRLHIGADGDYNRRNQQYLYFNSRLHIGADEGDCERTHERGEFQLTAPHRSRLIRILFFLQLLIFQLTAPHRSRPIRISQILQSRYFNSRLHIGADLICEALDCELDISTHGST